MPRPRFGNLDETKRQALLEAAQAEFAAYGFEASSYNRIIANSGLSKGSFYYYFDGKEDLYVEVVKEAVACFSEAVGDPGDAANPDEFWGQIDHLYRRYLRFGLDNPNLVGVLQSIAAIRPGAIQADLREKLLIKDTDWYKRLILRGQQLGAVRDDLPTDLLYAIIAGLSEAKDRWFFREWSEAGSIDVEQCARLMVHLFRRILLPGQALGAADFSVNLDFLSKVFD
ncbi:MAG: TetR/AcrR family transcriptional regulator [Phycisphaerae bacterium]|nr:TetR/AcrR family transcriptional regulator [Phycisphaerae bacterium]